MIAGGGAGASNEVGAAAAIRFFPSPARPNVPSPSSGAKNAAGSIGTAGAMNPADGCPLGEPTIADCAHAGETLGGARNAV